MTEPTNKPAGANGDPFGTELITQLANELFAESVGNSAAASSPHLASTTVSPQLGTGGGRLATTIPFGAPRYPGLTGGYPSATPDTHPPVHPGLQGWPPPPATWSGTGWGGHDPGSGETYPFGEPRCNGLDETQNQALPSTQPRREDWSSPDPYWAKPSDHESFRGGVPRSVCARFLLLARSREGLGRDESSDTGLNPRILSLVIQHRGRSTRFSGFASASERAPTHLVR